MRFLGLQRTMLRKIHVCWTVEGPLPGIHRWRIMLADTNFVFMNRYLYRLPIIEKDQIGQALFIKFPDFLKNFEI